MCFIENQQLRYDNVLSYRARISEDSLPELIRFVRENIGSMGMTVTGDIVFSVPERVTDSETGTSILGVEFIIPVDSRFKSSPKYVFKPRFRLENAVMYKYSGDIRELPRERKRLYGYVLENGLNAVTGVYYRVRELDGSAGVICMYIGISCNLL